MRYDANKKVPRRRQHDQHQKQYVPLPFGGEHNYNIPHWKGMYISRTRYYA